MSSKPVIYWPHAKAPHFGDWDHYPKESVVKIVIGSLGGGEPTDTANDVLDFEELAKGLSLFPNLTHLHLWGLAQLNPLPSLPTSLQSLDLRQCSGLEKLPSLPEALETLELAGCTALQTLSPTGSLKLRWLHVDDCQQLDRDDLNAFIKRCPQLEEFTAKNCTQLHSLALPVQSKDWPEPWPDDVTWHPRFPPRRLKKLVLEGCSTLRELPDLSGYRWLHHLNINGCGELKEMPRLHAAFEGEERVGIRTVFTHECVNLESFMGAPISKVHRSEREDHNVAGTFRTMAGAKWVEYHMAKVLFLGSGRCGKTTLSQSLEWAEMNPAQRAAHPEKNPRQTLASTDRIRFSAWSTPFGASGGPVGTAHIWDFGGQEVYHNTHRLFASEGSVFVIVTTDPKTHAARVEAELKGKTEAEKESLRNQNEYREIKYWLDYLRNALRLSKVEELHRERRKASVLVVWNGPTPANGSIDVLRTQAGLYQDLLGDGIPVVELDLHGVDFAGPDWRFQRIQAWVRESLGAAANGFCTQVPDLFARVASACQSRLEAARANRRPSVDPILDWAGWVEMVRAVLPDPTISKAQLEENCRAVARYLHNCGRIFCLKKNGTVQRVIVDQKWGVDLIYLVTIHAVRDPDTMADLRRLTRGVFEAGDLRETLGQAQAMFGPNRVGDWPEILADDTWPVLLDMLDQCEICVKSGDRWMAVQREMLGELSPSLEAELRAAWNNVVASPGKAWVNHSFAIHGGAEELLGNSDYRALVTYVGREMWNRLPDLIFPHRGGVPQKGRMFRKDGTEGLESEMFTSTVVDQPGAWFWNDGFVVKLQRSAGDADPDTAILRVEWSHRREIDGRRCFDGGLFFQFLTSDELECVPRLKRLLFENDGPLSFFKDKVKIHDERPVDLSQEVLHCLRGDGQPGWLHRDGPVTEVSPRDIAISYRGVDTEFVKALVAALDGCRTHGGGPEFSVYHYAEDDRLKVGAGPGGSFLTQIYRHLRSARVLLVVPSVEYFEKPALPSSPTESGTNLYCPVELADAVLATVGGAGESRPPESFFWVGRDGCVSHQVLGAKVEEVIQTFQKDVIAKRIGGKAAATAIARYEREVALNCSEIELTEFLNRVGRDAKQYVSIAGRPGGWDFHPLIERIRDALGGGRP